MAGGGKSKKVGGRGGANHATAPGALRKENLKAGSKLGLQQRQYQFAPVEATVVPNRHLPVIDTPTGPGVRDYPPPTKLFHSPATVSTPTAATHPSSSGNTLPEFQRFTPATQFTPPAIHLHAPPSHQPQGQPRRSSSHPLLSTQPPRQPISRSPEATSVPVGNPPHSRQSPHSSQAQNDVDEDEETDDDGAHDNTQEIEPTLSDDVLAAVNDLLRVENRD